MRNLWPAPPSLWDRAQQEACFGRCLSHRRGTYGHRLTMQNPTDSNSTSGSVIDLAPITAACRQLVTWYDRSLAGDKPNVTELERVMATMRELPVIPGRVGRDIELVVSGGDSSAPGETIGAIERLRLIANHNPQHSAPASTKPRDRERRQRSKKQRTDTQAPLPGFDRSAEEE